MNERSFIYYLCDPKNKNIPKSAWANASEEKRKERIRKSTQKGFVGYWKKKSPEELKEWGKRVSVIVKKRYEDPAEREKTREATKDILIKARKKFKEKRKSFSEEEILVYNKKVSEGVKAYWDTLSKEERSQELKNRWKKRKEKKDALGVAP